MTTPAGTPTWEHANDAATYGATTGTQNYQALGVVNPDTDLGADQFARMCEDLAAVQRVAVFATLKFTLDDTGNNHPTVSMVRMMNRVYSEAFSGENPPTGIPSVERVSDSIVDITFPTEVSDDFAQSAPINLAGAFGSASAGSTAAGVNWELFDDDTDGYYERCRIRVQNASGLVANATVVIDFYT